MANDYTVISTQPYSYLDQTGQVVDGYRVYFDIPEFGETHFVQVPNLTPAVVSKAVQALVDDRKSIATQ